MQEHKVIRIADVVAFFECTFHKPIESIHVYIHQELAREVAKRKTDSCFAHCMKTINNLLEQPKSVIVFDAILQQVHEGFMMNAREELFNIAFKHPGCSCIVLGGFVCELPESIDCPMCSFVLAARIGIVNEESIEEWIQYAIDCTMHEAIAYGCLVDVARFGIVDAKCMVRAMPIGSLR